ncbi:hypothetical protein mvi_27660 [Methylobacterium indicum]|uniref:Uncharacterized protein n=1 Tax=Methylobacterium indicum TaxID=1775910 RepID=A0A8H9C7F4_9HYPH|nr:hypothetical protein mvi_27660 [Methylobacterium indicum]
MCTLDRVSGAPAATIFDRRPFRTYFRQWHAVAIGRINDNPCWRPRKSDMQDLAGSFARGRDDVAELGEANECRPGLPALVRAGMIDGREEGAHHRAGSGGQGRLAGGAGAPRRRPFVRPLRAQEQKTNRP